MGLGKSTQILTAADVWTYGQRVLETNLFATARALVPNLANLTLDVSASMTRAQFVSPGGSDLGTGGCTVLTNNTITLRNGSGADRNIGICALCVDAV